MPFCKRLICVSFVFAFVNFAYANLSKRPQDTEAVIGSSVTFICQTLDQYSVNWEHTPVGSKTANDIYISTAIVRPYDARISMKVNRTMGKYELTIPSVQEVDAGRYECIDGAGHGERQGAELVVLVSHLVCQENINPDGVVGENDCGLQPDNIVFQCILRYLGNLSPVLEWRKTGGESITPKTVTIDRTEHQITVTAMMNPHLDMDGSSYTCQTNLSKYNWTSSRVKFLYVINTSTILAINVPTRVNCSANSSQPCQYTWFYQINQVNEILVREQLVLIDKPGSYHCVAECTIRGQTCKILPMAVEFSGTESIVSSGYQYLPLLWSVAGVTTLVIIVISVICFRFRYIKMKRGRSNFSSKLLVTALQHVQGIATVGKDLYIIHRKLKAVVIYRSDYPYDLREEIKREEFSNPNDIAAFKNCLYITDAGENCVWKFGLSPPKRFPAFIKNIGSPFTISISANGDIILARNPSSIDIYNLQGSILLTVQIKEGITDIHHVVRTGAGEFIVSHGIKEQEHLDITLISSDGLRCIKKYSESCKAQLGPLNQPSHIAIGEAGTVYVADAGHDKIIVLDEGLNPIHAVPLLDSSRPTRLCYKDGQLLIGESNGAVQFFGVEYLAGLRLISQVSVPKEDYANDTEESSLLQAHDDPAEN